MFKKKEEAPTVINNCVIATSPTFEQEYSRHSIDRLSEKEEMQQRIDELEAQVRTANDRLERNALIETQTMREERERLRIAAIRKSVRYRLLTALGIACEWASRALAGVAIKSIDAKLKMLKAVNE